MSSNYGYDASGMEREPFPARDEHAESRRVVPCERCLLGVGTTAPGPPHAPSTPGHAAHCSCDGCW